MSWNSKTAARALAALAICWVQSATAAEVCPSRTARPLQFVDVFDGPPEELATLVPDQAKERSGFWQLGYIYDAGRFVTVRCKYVDGKILDVKLSAKIQQCDFNIDRKKTLKVSCK